jgi:hypothetical protein
MPVRRQNHLGGSGRAVPRPGSRAASETATPPLRHDRRESPLGGDRDRARAPVAARGSAPSGAGDREVDLFVAAVVDASHAPQRGDRENCKLLIFSRSLHSTFAME